MSTDAGKVRASDAEREVYATMVREAVGEGRLSLAEGDERLAQIYAARHLDELRPLVTDLPRVQDGSPYAPGQPSYGPGHLSYGRGQWGPGPWATRGYGRWGSPGTTQPDTPGGRRLGLARHAGFVLVVAAALTGLWALTGATFFWPAIPLTFLVISLARHGFGPRWRRW